MAKENKRNMGGSGVTAGDLFSKLGRAEDAQKAQKNESLNDIAFDSLDLTQDGGESDSDLDLNALLRKYMPEFNEDEEAAPPAEKGGVLSRIKSTAAEERKEPKNRDEQLMSALDSAFSASAEDLFTEELVADEEDASDAGFVSEYDYENEVVEEALLEEDDIIGVMEQEEHLPDLPFEEEEEKPRGLFGLFGKKKDKAEKFRRNHREEALSDGEGAEEKLPPVEEEGILLLEDEVELPEEVPAVPVEQPEKLEKSEGMEEESEVPMLNLDPSAGMEEAVPAFAEAKDEAAETEDGLAYSLAPEGSEEDGELPAELEEEFDPTDINLMVAFGLDGGENKKADKAKAFGDRLEARQQARDSRRKLDHPEFIDKTQTPAFRKEFKNREIALWVKIAICAVLSLGLLVYENIALITRLFAGSEMQFAGAVDPAVYPTVYIMVSLQIMLLACYCAVDPIIAGFKYIFRGMPRPESMTAVLMVMGIVYSAVAAHLTVVPNEPVMFNFVVALSALLTLIYALINNKREMMNFRVVANKKPKHIVRRLMDEESECESKAFADAEDVCDVMKIEKTDFIDGFFGRLQRSEAATNIFMTFIMSITLAVAVLFGVFVHFRGGSASDVWRVIFGSLLVLAPLSVYVTFSYPFYRANVAASEYDSAIIGETSLEEYSNASIISFDDKNVFPSYSVKVQNIRIYNNARIDRVLYYAASVFAYAGGPLQDVFEVATKDMGTSENVQIFDTEAGFLATQVDGVNIIFGSCDALTARGLEIPANAAEDDVDLSDELSIMYMFRENKLVAKMYVKYVMDGDIDLILKQFSGSGLYVCVRTFDPNIDEAMIAKKLNMKRMPLKIVRYASADEVGRYEEKVDSGLVTCGSPKSLLHVISYCGKVLHTKKTNVALSVLSVMIGVSILVLLLLSNSMGMLSSLVIALYQLIWLIPMTISSRMFIR